MKVYMTHFISQAINLLLSQNNFLAAMNRFAGFVSRQLLVVINEEITHLSYFESIYLFNLTKL